MSGIRYALHDASQVPADIDWLSPGERDYLDSLRFEKRRQDWLLGRWTAKNAVLGIADEADGTMDRLEIARAADGAPFPLLHGRPLGARLSLSHSNDRALCTVTRDDADLGCDIELVEPRGGAFVETFFTASERAAVEAAQPHFRDMLITLIWSAKESTLKALRCGLKADTRSVEVMADAASPASGWQTARVGAQTGGDFACFWRLDGRFVLTVVARGAACAPAPIRPRVVAA